MQDSFVKVGDRVTFAKTVGECDIYLFAGITGDFSVNHINEQYMAHSKFGRRIAHGALIVGYMSNSIIDRQPRSASVIAIGSEEAQRKALAMFADRLPTVLREIESGDGPPIARKDALAWLCETISTAH